MDSAVETSGSSAPNGKRRRFRAQGFQLDENPRALFAVILFLVLAGYAFVDALIVPAEGYVSTPPYWLFVLVGLAGAAVAYVFLTQGRVPRTESVGVAALLGVAAAFAMLPGFLRISSLVNDAGFEKHTYVMAADFTLRDKDGQLPSFKGPLDERYWHDHVAGDRWDIEMRQGLLGVWSYRVEPLQQEIEAYNARKAIVQGLQQGFAKPSK